MTDTLTYVFFSLRRASENAYSWSLTPNEAGALVAEVERLRAEVAWLRGERAAVVAWLREAWGAVNLVSTSIVSAEIERGEHRREEEK